MSVYRRPPSTKMVYLIKDLFIVRRLTKTCFGELSMTGGVKNPVGYGSEIVTLRNTC